MITDYEKLIFELNKRSKLSIGNEFCLTLCNGNGYVSQIYKSGGTQKAINRLDNNIDSEVDVIHWFDSYYLYVEVKFVFGNGFTKRKKIRNRTILQCSISISVFKSIENNIVQLFRAEWDDYNDNQTHHPQPHWHIASDSYSADTFQVFTDICPDNDFASTIKSEKYEVSALRKFHFAMNCECREDMSHIVQIESIDQVINWFTGLLSTIKSELQYIDGF